MNAMTPLATRLARRALLGTGAASIGVGLAGLGHASETLRIAYSSTFPPVSFLDGDTMKGILIDTLDEVLGKRLGLTLSHQGYPWARAQEW
jgi:polar amino acid transport system substrate-binding protein